MIDLTTSEFRYMMGQIFKEVAEGEEALIFEARYNRYFKLSFHSYGVPGKSSPHRRVGAQPKKAPKPYESILPPELRGDR